jgi:hypothetical protein
VKTRILCVLLLLSACADKVPYDYGLTWVCLAPEGCERTEEVMLIDRLNVQDDFFFFHSTRDEQYFEGAQRFGSESLPAGCWWLYGVLLFAKELEPAKVCPTSGGFDMELSIPNRDTMTHSQWRVEARELGVI